MHFRQNAQNTKSEDGIRRESCVEERRPSDQSLPKAMGLTPAPFQVCPQVHDRKGLAKIHRGLLPPEEKNGKIR
jgi:hypothetical protein